MLVVVENVPRFPPTLLNTVFGDMYDMQWIILDATRFGSPGRRRRLYVVLALRGKLQLNRGLDELSNTIDELFTERRSWEALVEAMMGFHPLCRSVPEVTLRYSGIRGAFMTWTSFHVGDQGVLVRNVRCFV